MHLAFALLLGLALHEPPAAPDTTFWAVATSSVSDTTRTKLPVYFQISRIGPDSLGAEQRQERELLDSLARDGFDVQPASSRTLNAGDHVVVDIGLVVDGLLAYRTTSTVYCRTAPIPNSAGDWTWRIIDAASSSSWTLGMSLLDPRAPHYVVLPQLTSQLTCERRIAR